MIMCKNIEIMSEVHVVSYLTSVQLLCCFLSWLRDPAILDSLDLTEEERRVLIDNINRRLTPQAVKIRAGEFFPDHY